MIAGLLLSSCAQQNLVWVKPGASNNQFPQDRYDCLQRSQQAYSSSHSSNTGGVVSPNAISTSSSSAGMTTNEQLFNACMNSKGWNLVRQNPIPNGQQQINQAASPSEATKICQNKGLKPDTYPFSECMNSLGVK